MNKILRRIISIMIATIMILNLNIAALAAGNSQTSSFDGVETLNDGSYVLRDSTSSGTYVKAYDLDNGNSVFEQYENNKLTSKYIVQFGQNSINATYYDEAATTNETIKTPQSTDVPIPFAKGTSSGRLGRIRFQYTDGSGTGICGAHVDYVKNTGSKKYDITGTYRNLAGLASFIASVLALPAAPALAISKAVLTYFGIGLGAVSIFLPSFNLQSTYEENEYTLIDMNLSSHRNSFYGTKYTITEAGSHMNKVYTEGDYFPTSAWKTQNFGTTIYNYLFSYSYWKIYAWN